MSLELRCPRHPSYNGYLKPGDTSLIEPAPGTIDFPDPARGSQSCPDCWELYRKAHEVLP